jgi:hypothetical protein
MAIAGAASSVAFAAVGALAQREETVVEEMEEGLSTFGPEFVS